MKDKCQIKESLEKKIEELNLFQKLVNHHSKEYPCSDCNGYDKNKSCYIGEK